MINEIIKVEATSLSKASSDINGFVPAIVINAKSQGARYAWDEFFAEFRDNPNTLRAYRHAITRFLAWCEERNLELHEIMPGHVSEYVTEHLVKKNGQQLAKRSRKLHLSAIKNYFDKCVERHGIVINPADSVKGPKLQYRIGVTKPLSPKQMRKILSSIDTTNVIGLRDRSIIGVLVYTGARVGAVSKLRIKDYYFDGSQHYFSFEEKGGREGDIACRHDLEQFVKEYIMCAGLMAEDSDNPLFRTAMKREKGRPYSPRLTSYQRLNRNLGVKEVGRMTENDIMRMVQRRFKDAGIPEKIFSCHSFRAGVATDLLEHGVQRKDVQNLLGHADERTTALYDHTSKKVTRNVVERISV